MTTAFARLPILVIAAVAIGVAVAVSLLGMFAVRRWVFPRVIETDGDGEFVGAMVQAILVFYALAVALVAVGSWDRHSELDDQVSTEAATIATLYREAQLYPEPVRSDIQQDIVDYLHYIVDEAWPAQDRGEIPNGGTELITSIQEQLGAFEPATNGQQAFHEQALDTFDQVIELRRLRLDAIEGHLSAAMWVFVIGGGGLAIASSFFFRVTDWRVQAIMISLLATFVAMVIVLITAYNQPFVGDLQVQPDSFRLVLETAIDG